MRSNEKCSRWTRIRQPTRLGPWRAQIPTIRTPAVSVTNDLQTSPNKQDSWRHEISSSVKPSQKLFSSMVRSGCSGISMAPCLLHKLQSIEKRGKTDRQCSFFQLLIQRLSSSMDSTTKKREAWPSTVFSFHSQFGHKLRCHGCLIDSEFRLGFILNFMCYPRSRVIGQCP